MGSIGQRYIGSEKLMTSKKNEEVIPNPPSNWTVPYTLYNFQFKNKQDCTVTINKHRSIFIEAGDGFTIEANHPPITSFVIKEADVIYNWIATY